MEKGKYLCIKYLPFVLAVLGILELVVDTNSNPETGVHAFGEAFGEVGGNYEVLVHRYLEAG